MCISKFINNFCHVLIIKNYKLILFDNFHLYFFFLNEKHFFFVSNIMFISIFFCVKYIFSIFNLKQFRQFCQ